MSRFATIYLFFGLVILAVCGLAFYSYRSSVELATVERDSTLATLSELAKEKILGIEAQITGVEGLVFDAVDLQDLAKSEEELREKRVPIESVLVLDADGRILPGGFFTVREGEEPAAFRKLFEEQIRPALGLQTAASPIFHHQNVYEGRPYLFGIERRVERGKVYYVAVEADLTYLVGSVFPQFFDVRSPHLLYQIVDEGGNIIYGFSFAGIKTGDIVATRFPDTLTRWSLRVAQRDAGNLASRSEKQATVDLILISLALVVIVAGLGFMLWAMRRERRLNQLKSDFISNVSHELKTPLSIISMFGELLSMGRARSEEQATEYAEIIRRESVRLSRLIDNVLDFAKIERGVNVYEFVSDQDLGDVARRALEISSHRVDSAKMTLESEIAPELPTASLDANAMTLAILNLVDNAIKYAVSGERLIVRVLEQDRGRERGIALEVRDFGTGVPLEEREQIFERFYRAKGVRLKPIRGSGIGLALVRHIAEAHHGHIEVEDADGGGSLFRLWIPAEDDKRS